MEYNKKFTLEYQYFRTLEEIIKPQEIIKILEEIYEEDDQWVKNKVEKIYHNGRETNDLFTIIKNRIFEDFSILCNIDNNERLENIFNTEYISDELESGTKNGNKPYLETVEKLIEEKMKGILENIETEYTENWRHKQNTLENKKFYIEFLDYFKIISYDYEEVLNEKKNKLKMLKDSKLYEQNRMYNLDKNEKEQCLDALEKICTEYYNFNEYEKFKKICEFGLVIFPQKASFLGNLGLNFMNKGDFKKAEELFMKAIEIDPNTYQVYVNLGIIFQMTKHFDKAEEYYKKSIQVKENSRAYIGLGDISYESEKFEEAKNYYEKALEIDSVFNKKIYNSLGNVYDKLGDSEKMEKSRKTASELITIYEANQIFENLKNEGVIEYQEFVKNKMLSFKSNATLLSDEMEILEKFDLENIDFYREYFQSKFKNNIGYLKLNRVKFNKNIKEEELIKVFKIKEKISVIEFYIKNSELTNIALKISEFNTEIEDLENEIKKLEIEKDFNFEKSKLFKENLKFDDEEIEISKKYKDYDEIESEYFNFLREKKYEIKIFDSLITCNMMFINKNVSEHRFGSKIELLVKIYENLTQEVNKFDELYKDNLIYIIDENYIYEELKRLNWNKEGLEEIIIEEINYIADKEITEAELEKTLEQIRIKLREVKNENSIKASLGIINMRIRSLFRNIKRDKGQIVNKTIMNILKFKKEIILEKLHNIIEAYILIQLRKEFLKEGPEVEFFDNLIKQFREYEEDDILVGLKGYLNSRK